MSNTKIRQKVLCAVEIPTLVEIEVIDLDWTRFPKNFHIHQAPHHHFTTTTTTTPCPLFLLGTPPFRGNRPTPHPWVTLLTPGVKWSRVKSKNPWSGGLALWVLTQAKIPPP